MFMCASKLIAEHGRFLILTVSEVSIVLAHATISKLLQAFASMQMIYKLHVDMGHDSG